MSPPAAATTMGPAHAVQARRGLGLFFGAVLLGSGACEGLMLYGDRPIREQPALALINMWIPGLAALLARLVLREGFGDVSFALGGRRGLRMLALGWLAPLAVGGVGYGLAWGLGLAELSAPGMVSVGMGGASVPAKFALSLALNLSVGTLLAGLSAAGEELGWRGYMLTRLIDAGCPRPVLCSGLIWSAWHLPLIVGGLYAAGPSPWLSALLFSLSTTAQGCVAARLRLVSGSVWPAVVYHSAWNALIQGVFDAFTRGGDADEPWTGEPGLFVALANVLLALTLMRRPWPALRRPDQPALGIFDLGSA